VTSVEGSGDLPNLIMVGPGKSGTTSLFWYLSQHPDVCAADVKELKYFAPITHGDGRLGPVEDYASHFGRCGDQRYRLEASPQYFHGGEAIIDAIRRIVGEAKIVVTLREPVDRLWSIYRSLKVRTTIPASMTIEDYVARCEEVRAKAEPLTLDNRAFWTLSGERYAAHLRPWLDAFGDDARVVFFEDMVREPASATRAIAGWLGIDEACVDAFSFTVENRTVANRSGALHRLALAANRSGLLGERRRVKGPLRKLYYGVNSAPQAERLPQDVRLRLHAVFAPDNAELADELRQRGYAGLPPWLEGSPSPGAPTTP